MISVHTIQLGISEGWNMCQILRYHKQNASTTEMLTNASDSSLFRKSSTTKLSSPQIINLIEYI